MPTQRSDVPRPFGPSLRLDLEVFDDLSLHTPWGLATGLGGDHDETESTDAE